MRILKNVLLFLFFLVFTLIISGYVYYQKIKSFSVASSKGVSTILILGKGGIGHAAPDLTDTIIMANLNQNSNALNFISLPRDIWVEATKAKLNSSYYWGKQKGEKDFKLLGDSIEEVTGIRPNYVVVVDFSIFKDLVDTIGGIDVDIENSFVDDKYPIVGKEEDLCGGDKLLKCRYETLKFDKGIVHMNGELALKFVRSRNSSGDEGTDLAREKRQQKVISAVKNKLLSSEIILSPKILSTLFSIGVKHVETNIDSHTIQKIVYLLYQSRKNINYFSIPESILKVSQGDKKYGKQYIFLPNSGTWKELHEWIKNKV